MFGVSFKNHLLCSPFIENQADRKGMVTPALIRHYVSMIQQGVGAVIVESAYVSQQGRSNLHQLGISEEEHLPGLSKLVKAVKNEGGVIGISLTHAGAKTSEFIDLTLSRLTFYGAIYLSIVCILPDYLIKYFNIPFYFGGTSLLIVVGVSLDTMQQIESHLVMRNYDGFVKKGRLRSRRG